MHFEGFCGNTQTKKTLSGLFDRGRIPHAILIDGPDGCGKKTLARIIAAAAVCEKDGEKPCGECRQCKNTLLGIHPDIKLYEGEGDTNTIKIDVIRDIRLDAYVLPNDSARKVFIIANAENMTEMAQNALLKVLEEPPTSVMFILTCDSRVHLLETVRSRTQCITVNEVSEKEAADALLKACRDITPDEALRAARISGGNIGKAKIMLGEGFGAISEFISAFVKAWCSQNLYNFLAFSGTLSKDKELFASLLDILPVLIRDALAIRNDGVKTLSGFDSEAKLLSNAATLKKLTEAQNAVFEAQQAAKRYANYTLNLTALFSKLWRCIH